VVGYTCGTTADPTYQSIGDHSEAIRITYDPAELDAEELMRRFWQMHQPMPMAFTGNQYRSAIFTHSAEQKAQAETVMGDLMGSNSLVANTKLEPASTFYRAEEYHQRFISKQTGRFNI